LDRIKVCNDRRYDIGVRLSNNTERVIPAGGFALLPKEEVEYLFSIAPKLFAGERQLRLEDRKLAVEFGFIQDEAAPLFGDAEIRKQLAGRVAAMKKWLDGITEPFLLDEIFTVARAMDLPASKLQVLQEKFPDRLLIQPDIEDEAI